jgi:endonuclease/exonuclease/phosphatase family metal-dependent hydrolase
VKERARLLVLAGLATLWGCVGETPEVKEPTPTDGELQVLTYNVHGLPPEITLDDTTIRMTQIGPLLSTYDLVGLQEDFIEANHEILASASDHPTQRWFGDVLEERIYGSGLAVLADLTEVEHHHEHYADCNGFLEDSSDCMASKGFQMMRLELAEGVEIDVYNSHLEAGGGEDDVAARESNVEQIVAAMETLSDGRALMFLGDTNLHEHDEEDLPLLELWEEEIGWVDACETVDCEEPGRIDRVLLRGGGGVSLEAMSWALEPEFFDDEGVPLSDHDALSVGVRWSVD